MELVVLSVVVALIMIIGPMMWLRPRPEDRRRMKLRNVAYRRGWRVRKVDQALIEQLSGLDNVNGLYLYWKPWAEGILERLEEETLEPRLMKEGERVPMLDAVQALPPVSEDFEGWYIDGQGAGFIWDETGSEDQLKRMLERLEQALLRFAC